MRHRAIAVSSLLASLFALAGAASGGIVVRDVTVDDFAQFKGGLLYKNGRETSCEVGLINLSAAFVAANCLDYTTGLTVNTKTEYAVWIYNSADGTSVIKSAINPSDIRVHPAYDPKSFANNVAVIQFNKGVVAPYTSYINTDLNLSSVQGYVRRTFNSTSGNWNRIQMASQSNDSSGCEAPSPLYAEYKSWFACSAAMTRSNYNGKCGIPYGTVYYVTQGQIVLSAIYSHSVVYGKGTCEGGGTVWRNYYTQLWPYVGLAVTALGHAVDIYANLAPVSLPLQGFLTMDSPNITATAAAAKVGGIVVGGDFYALQGANVGNESSSADESSSDEDSSESSSGGSTDGPSDSSDDSSDHSVGHSHTEQSSDDSLGSVDNSSGFTKTQKIIVGVVVPIGVIIIGIGCAILYRIWASKRQDRAWNPRDNMVQLQNAANEIGRGDALPLTPPTYESSVYIPPLQAPKPIDLSDPDAKVPGKE